MTPAPEPTSAFFAEYRVPFAGDFTVSATADGLVEITLTGSDANIFDSLRFEILTLPASGEPFENNPVALSTGFLTGDTLFYGAASNPVTRPDTFTFILIGGTVDIHPATVTVDIID